MPFGVANASAFFQELRSRPLVQEFISRGAEIEAQIGDVILVPIPKRAMLSPSVRSSLLFGKTRSVSNERNASL